MSVDNPKLFQPKRFQKRKKKQGYQFKFARVARSTVSASQDAVQRVGDAIIGGDYTGDARGSNAIDIQVSRSNANQVASGANAIAYGVNARVAGGQAVGIGANVVAAGDLSVSFGTNAEARGAGQIVFGSDASAEDTADVALVVGNTAYGAGAYSAVFGAEASASGARGVAIGYQAISTSDDEAVIAGTVLKLQIAVGTKKVVLTEANYASYIDLSTKVSKSGDTMTGPLVVDGSSDTIQLRVQGHSTQTSNLQTWETSAAAVVASIDNAGKVTVKDAEIAKGDVYSVLKMTAAQYTSGGGRIDFYEHTTRHGYILCNAYSLTLHHAGEILLEGPLNPRESIVPYTDYSINLGSSSKRWANLHAGTLSLNVQYADNVVLKVRAAPSQTADLTQWLDASGAVQMAVTANGRDWALDTTTGSKFGTSSSQKLGFWNATPVVRQGAFTQTYSTADKTIAARASSSLTDSIGGTTGTTLAAIPDPGDAPASADALRDDLVANVLPKIRDALSSLAAQSNNHKTDSDDIAQGLNSVIDDLQTIGLLA